MELCLCPLLADNTIGTKREHYEQLNVMCVLQNISKITNLLKLIRAQMEKATLSIRDVKFISKITAH